MPIIQESWLSFQGSRLWVITANPLSSGLMVVTLVRLHFYDGSSSQSLIVRANGCNRRPLKRCNDAVKISKNANLRKTTFLCTCQRSKKRLKADVSTVANLPGISWALEVRRHPHISSKVVLFPSPIELLGYGSGGSTVGWRTIAPRICMCETDNSLTKPLASRL